MQGGRWIGAVVLVVAGALCVTTTVDASPFVYVMGRTSGTSRINVLTVIDAATQPWGVKVTRIEIKDLTPPADITEAMARQMKAERLKRAQILEAEGDRASAILKAEGQKQSQILEAEGRREAAFRDAEARERAAEAEAKATEVVSEAIAKGDVNAINYFLGLKYVEAFAKLASSNQQRTVIVPADFAGLVGAIEGVKALTDNVKRQNATGGNPPNDGSPFVTRS